MCVCNCASRNNPENKGSAYQVYSDDGTCIKTVFDDNSQYIFGKPRE